MSAALSRADLEFAVEVLKQVFPDRTVIVSMLASPEVRKVYEAAGVMLFDEPTRAVRAARALVYFAQEAQRARTRAAPPHLPAAALAPPRHAVNEAEAKAELQQVIDHAIPDAVRGFHMYRLSQPLAPGAALRPSGSLRLRLLRTADMMRARLDAALALLMRAERDSCVLLGRLQLLRAHHPPGQGRGQPLARERDARAEEDDRRGREDSRAEAGGAVHPRLQRGRGEGREG